MGKPGGTPVFGPSGGGCDETAALAVACARWSATSRAMFATLRTRQKTPKGTRIAPVRTRDEVSVVELLEEDEEEESSSSAEEDEDEDEVPVVEAQDEMAPSLRRSATT
jgi:hypothetical protein